MNKNMKKLYIGAAAGLLLMGTTGCIEETLPTDFVLGSQIAESETAVGDMVNGIYTNMVGYVNDDGGVETISYSCLRLMFEAITTPFVCCGNNGYNTIGVWGYGSVNVTGRGIYPSYTYYGWIKTVNDIIGLIDPNTDDATLQSYLGIAYAYRALFYHELTQLFAYKTPGSPSDGYTYTQPTSDITNLAVPIVTDKTTPEEGADNPRATVDECYDLILSDLAAAEKYLTGFSRTDKIQPDVATIYAMYAQVYLSLASRASESTKYTNESELWQQAAKYAQQAIQTSGCTWLTKDEWQDPVNGFNNRNSQNSWLWATTISPDNTDAVEGGYWGSFQFAMLIATETNYSAYGYWVGRALNRVMYEKLSDYDWRKMSWIDPSFFYTSTNQVEGQPYVVEKDPDGAIINNKWENADGSYNNDYDGFGPNKEMYKLNPTYAEFRANIYGNGAYGNARPWLYVPIKFRPAQGAWNNQSVGGAVDNPIIRVEELYFIQAEATMHTSGVAAAAAVIDPLLKQRNPMYAGIPTSSQEAFMEELIFQKQIEFWGEGVNFFDSKRLALGLHRQYAGINLSQAAQAQEVPNIHPAWCPPFNQAEQNGNPAIYLYNNPYTAYTQFMQYVNDNGGVQWLYDNYGKPLTGNEYVLDFGHGTSGKK